MTVEQKTSPAINWPVFFGFWLFICAVYLARANFSTDALPLVSDNDDAMRLTVVRDWLAGQGWFDHTQYRLNTPFGAEIHWSRLVDIPIAALVLLFQPFLGGGALIAAAWVWPLILLLALLYLSVRLSMEMAGPEALLPGLVLPVLSAAIMVEFAPGRVDHHSVQIILTLGLLYACVMAWKHPRWAIWAALGATTSLAVGMEALPQIAAAIMVFGLFWVFDARKAHTMRLFGIAFTLTGIGHFAIALPPSKWFQPACDALSSVHASAAIGVGAVFVALSLLRLKSPLMRLVAGGALGLGMVGGLLILFPECLGGPYAAVDQWLKEHWLAQIIEAKPAWSSLSALPAFTTGILVPPLAAIAGVVWIVLKRPELPGVNQKQAQWLIVGFFLVLGIAVTLIQIRGARLVAAMIAPVGAFVIIFVRQRYLETKKFQNAIGLLSTWLVFCGLAVAVITGLVLPKDAIASSSASGTGSGTDSESGPQNKYDCWQPEAFDQISALPATRIMAPVDLGAHLLLFTDHSVVGAPYHRNGKGLLDTFAFFNRPLEQARSLLEERDISLVVTCGAQVEMRGFSDTPDSAFVKLAAAGELPEWLVEISRPGATLQIYRVTASTTD